MSLLVDYTHEPLPKGRFIRLVSLHPSPSSKSPLYIKITTHHLDKAPPYAAVSYTWGGSPDTVPIWCDRWIIRIRKNLEGALRRFRHPERPRQLWIDALCINQTSTAEKNHQIPFMGEIYRKAEGVLIWLGEEADESRLAVQLLSLLPFIGLRSLPDTAKSPSTSEPETGKDPLSVHDIVPRDNKAWSALKKLLQRPWFSRVWIIQEVHFAKHATIVCGPDCVSWSAISNMNRKSWVELRDLLGLPYNKLLPLWMCRKPRPLAFLLVYTADSMSSEPRDKIYALLGLVKKKERMLDDFPATIDYDIPLADLYMNVTSWCMSRTPKLLPFLLELASVRGSVENLLPSWAIDWSMSRIDRTAGRWTRDRDWNDAFAVLSTQGYDVNKLPLSGVKLDTVGIVGVAPAWNSTFLTSYESCESTFLEALQDWQNLVEKVVIGREDLIQTFFHTLLAYDLNHHSGQKMRKMGFHKICDQLGLYKLDPKCHTPRNVLETCKLLYRHVGWKTFGKKMCLTSSGRLCMCPEKTEKGDVMVHLKLLKTSSAKHSRWKYNASCVLRKEGPYYSLVGRCFVYGGVHRNGPTEVFVLV